MSNIRQNYRTLLESIKKIAEESGRSSQDITLVAVSKYASLEQLKEAYDLGIRNFAESRVQEALLKKAALPKDILWHFIGRIQSNKLPKMIGEFALIHSVADYQTIEALSKRSSERGLVQPLLLQVNVSGEASKQGFTCDEVQEVYKKASSYKGISLKGLMTMAPHTDDLQMIRRCFSRLRDLQKCLPGTLPHPHLSMGMSSDYHIAIEEGATLLRIGSLLFG